MKLEGKLPEIRLTAIVLPGAISNHVRILGPRGGGVRPSSLPRPKRKFILKRRGKRQASARLPKAA